MRRWQEAGKGPLEAGSRGHGLTVTPRQRLCGPRHGSSGANRQRMPAGYAHPGPAHVGSGTPLRGMKKPGWQLLCRAAQSWPGGSLARSPGRTVPAHLSAPRGLKHLQTEGAPGPRQLSQPIASNRPLQRPCVPVKGTCFLNQTCPFPQFSSSAGLDGHPSGARVAPWQPQLPSGQSGGQRRSRRWTGTQCRENRAGVKKAARLGCPRQGERGCRRPPRLPGSRSLLTTPFS